jgi:hypothetical protein
MYGYIVVVCRISSDARLARIQAIVIYHGSVLREKVTKQQA